MYIKNLSIHTQRRWRTHHVGQRFTHAYIQRERESTSERERERASERERVSERESVATTRVTADRYGYFADRYGSPYTYTDNTYIDNDNKYLDTSPVPGLVIVL